MANRIMLNQTSYHGAGAIQEIVNEAKAHGFKKAFVCSDPDLVKFNVTSKVTDLLKENGLDYELYSDIKPNPTIENVQHGVQSFKDSGADYLIAIGGGSSMDTSKAIGIIIANPEFEDVRSLEGVAPTKKPCVPIIAVPTTAGTAAEVTINYVVTDVERKRKFVCVDPHDMPIIAIIDPEMMSSMPKGLTASTGMDALTHAVEALVTPGAYNVTKKLSIGAIELIKEFLPRAVENGHDIEAREAMVNAIFLGGMAFNNAGLGYVHSMAHQLGAVYNLPHGVCCAMLLPVVERENAKRVPEAFRNVAKALGLHTEGKSDKECADYAISEIEKLSATVGIPKKLTELDIKEEEFDFEYLSKNALIDACAPGNPFMPTLEETIALYKELF